MGSRVEAIRRCWANVRLRRALAAYLLFNIGEWANWIALLVWAYSEAGVRGASVIAVVQLVPAALLASSAEGAEGAEVPLHSHGSLTLSRALMAAGLVDRVQVTFSL